MITQEEVALLLSKWRDEHTTVLFVATLSGLAVSVQGRIASFNGNFLKVTSSDERCSAVFALSSGVAFEYGESKEYNFPFPPESKARAGLVIALGSGTERIFFIVAEGNSKNL